LPQYIITILVIAALAIGTGSLIATLFQYQQQEESRKAIYEIQLEVRKKLLIDSVFSAYEGRHRSRLDSISVTYRHHVDSLTMLINQLKKETDVIQANVLSADSLLPVY